MAKKHAQQREQNRDGASAEAPASSEAAASHDAPARAGLRAGAGQAELGDIGILAERLRTGRVVLCTGAGIGAVTWRKLVERLLDRVGPTAEAGEARSLLVAHPLAVSGYARRALGDGFQAALAEAVPASAPLSEVAELCGKLPFRAALTTSIDDTLVRALGTDGTPARSYSAAQAGEARRDGRGRYVLRVLGDAQTGEGLVFSESDLSRALADESFRKLVHEMYARRTFLFLGFDGGDPDFELLVGRVLAGAGQPAEGGEPQHFAVLPGLPRVVQEELEAAFGVKALTGTTEADVLRALVAAVGEHAGEILPDDDDLEGWLRVIQQEPGRADAVEKLAALESRLEASEDPADADRLIELWLGRIDGEQDAAGRARALRSLARILEQKKGQMAEAFTSLVEAYKEEPAAALLDELERLAGTTGQWADLLTALREKLPSLPAGERPALWVRIARLYGDKLNHADYALASIAEAQKLDIKDEAAKRELLTLRVELCRRSERWKDLAEALGRLAEETEAADKKLDLFLEQGEIYESRLSDGVSAATAFKKARLADPSSRDVLAALEHALRRSTNWADLISLLDEKAELLGKAGEDGAALRARREAAQLHAEHQSDKKATAERWEAVRKAAPGDIDALRALEKLYAAEGNLSEHYLGVVNALADSVPSDKERLTLYRRLVAEYEELPGHEAQAEKCLEKILQLDAKAEDAYRGLERRYRQAKKWEPLVETLRKHAAHAEGHARAELLAALAKVYETDLPASDPEKQADYLSAATEAWQRVIDVEPQHPAALDALARLLQSGSSPAEAVRLLEKRAHLAEDKSQKVALFIDAARVAKTRLRDPLVAEENFVRALEIDPQHGAATASLADLYREKGEYLRAAKLYIEAESRTQNRLDKARFLVEAAKQHLAVEESQRAGELFRQALQIDPEHAEAGAGAAELFYQQERYDDALPILDMLARKDAEPAVLVVRLCRLGQVAQRAGRRDKALRAFTRAVDLAPTDLTALRGLLPLLVEVGQFQDARKGAKSALEAHKDEISTAERVDLLAQLGLSEHKLGHDEAALAALHQALELDPQHRGALRAITRLGNLPAVDGVAYRQTLLKSLLETDPRLAPAQEPNVDDEKVRLYTEIGDLYAAGPLADAQAAIASYREGLALRPDSLTIMNKLLEVYSGEGLWADASGILETLIKSEKNDKRRARFRQAAALIARDQLKDAPRALALYHGALDDDATIAKALDAIEELAVQVDDPREILRAYQRKIQALGPDTADTPKQRAERLRLWTQTAALCIQRLGDFQTGAQAYEVTLSLDGANLDRRRQMAAIWGQIGGDKLDRAIAEHQALLLRNKSDLDSYRSLRELYLRTGQREKAAAVAYALQLLRRAEPEDAALVDELKARPLVPAKRPIGKELWRLVSHEDEHPLLGVMSSLLWPAVRVMGGRGFAELGLDRGARVDVAAGHFYTKALKYGFEALEAPIPELYPEPRSPEMAERSYEILLALEKTGAGDRPVTALRIGAPLLSPKRPEREVMYEVGRLAALLRPERSIRVAYDTPAKLGAVIDAVIAAGGDAAGATSRAAHDLAQTLGRALPAQQADQLGKLGRALAEANLRGEAAAATWLGAMDLTAVRAGLLLAGDLETAALLLATDPPGTTPLSPKQRLLDLIHFTVTEDYFTLRQHLGLMA